MGVKTYTGPDGGKQKLSRAARAKRNADNIAMAKTKDRKDKKAENQAFVDADGNKGQRSDSDIHHTKSGTQVRTSIAYNRATHTRGEVKS
tara:strand:- start:371 stop:640 length:270 start_codon:yes stop_codon:yes gene_type:complete